MSVHVFELQPNGLIVLYLFFFFYWTSCLWIISVDASVHSSILMMMDGYCHFQIFSIINKALTNILSWVSWYQCGEGVYMFTWTGQSQIVFQVCGTTDLSLCSSASSFYSTLSQYFTDMLFNFFFCQLVGLKWYLCIS